MAARLARRISAVTVTVAFLGGAAPPAGAATLPFYNPGTEDAADWSFWTCGSDWSINEVSAPTKSGPTALRFDVRGDCPGNGFHSQAKATGLATIGATRYVGLAVYVPTTADGDARGFTFHQWINDDLKTPVFMLSANTEVDKFSATIIWGSGQYVVRNFGQIPYGQWSNFVVKTDFSADPTGRVVIWRDHLKEVEYDGPTTYDNAGPLGMTAEAYGYGDLPAGQARVVCIDEIRAVAATADPNADYEAVYPYGTATQGSQCDDTT